MDLEGKMITSFVSEWSLICTGEKEDRKIKGLTKAYKEC